MSIKAIILDVDGVIVGEKMGFNSPYPHPSVIEKLKSIREQGIIISLCTAKPYRSVEKIVTDANLNNLHITDGGSVIIDPIDQVVLKKAIINKRLAFDVIQTFTSRNIYTEFYSLDSYYAQENSKSDITSVHNHILQFDATMVKSLAEESTHHDVVKIMPIAQDEKDKDVLSEIFKPYENSLTLSWGVHPIALPRQFGIITTKDATKQQAAAAIATQYRINHDEILGVGDSTSDWQFIKECEYGAAMGNASDRLKELVLSKRSGHAIIGGHVDENGVLEILNHFLDKT